jgi:rhodanese-related sulfurtransferase
MQRHRWFVLFTLLAAFMSLAVGCGDSSSSNNISATNFTALKSIIEGGSTVPDNPTRVLIVDVRKSEDYITGHIKDSLSVPLNMIAAGDAPVYTNGYDQLNTTASIALKDSWLAHMLINQLVNDFFSTYENSTIIFYGSTENEGRRAAKIAKKIGYKNVSCLSGDFTAWSLKYPNDVSTYYTGVESVNQAEGSFLMTGFINNANFENVSQHGTHHGIIFKGGGLHSNGIFQVDLPPFGFQELLTYLGADPSGNMATGIFFGDMSEWGNKFTNGQKIEFTVTWPATARYYALNEVFQEKPSQFQPLTPPFVLVGIEPRIGGTRESNLNWNPGCIFCFYSCVCGITSNAKANENTWFADGGIYDFTADPRNYYAGRYYPRMDILPGKGQPITIKVRILK